MADSGISAVANPITLRFVDDVRGIARSVLAQEGVRLFQGRITEVRPGNKVIIQRPEASAPRSVPSPVVDVGYVPKANDMAWCLDFAGGVVVLGPYVGSGITLPPLEFLPLTGGRLTGAVGTLEIATPNSQHIRLFNTATGEDPADYVLMDNFGGTFRMYHYDASAAAYRLFFTIDNVTGVASFGSDIKVLGKSLTEVTTANPAAAGGWGVINPIVLSKAASGIVSVSGRLQATTARAADAVICVTPAGFVPADKGMFPCSIRDAAGLWLFDTLPVYPDASVSRLKIARGLALNAHVDLGGITYAT